jgi:hypothetical protein
MWIALLVHAAGWQYPMKENGVIAKRLRNVSGYLSAT